MHYEIPDPTKLRNATLLVGVILLALSFAQVEIDLGKPVAFLGIPLTVIERNILTYALMAVSTYYLFRYWFYAMRRKSTWVVRRWLREEFVKKSDGIYYSTKLANDSAIANRYEALDHAGIDYDYRNSFSRTDEDKNVEYWQLEMENPRWRGITTVLRDLDFAAPALVNVLALAVAVANVVG